MAYDDSQMTKSSKASPTGMLELMALPGPPLFSFSTVHNVTYFQMQNGNGLGHAYIVGQSQFKLNNVAKDLSHDEVEKHLDIAGLVCSLMSGQWDKLATMLKKVVTIIQCQSTSSCKSLWTARLPLSPAELCSMYVEDKYAFLPNLPRPPIQSVGDDAYVSLKDCIADVLGHGLEVDSICTVNQGTNSVS